jgi:ribosome-associated translation inhibitor RaiA
MTHNSSNPTIVIQANGMKFDDQWLKLVHEKTAHLDRFGNNILEFKVELTHNNNPRQSDKAWTCVISALIQGRMMKATGQASDEKRAFEFARETMESNLRRAARRHRYSRHGRKATLKVSQTLED